MSQKLQLLARRMNLQAPEKIPAPADDDLTAAIQQLVDRRVGQALEQQPAKQPARVQQLLDRQFNKPQMPTDYRQLPRPPKAPRPPLDMKVYRDGAGKISWCEMSDGVKFKAVRDGAGSLIGIEEIRESPISLDVDTDDNAAARKYNPGEPR